MTGDPQFFDDCLGAGLQFDGTNLNVVTEPGADIGISGVPATLIASNNITAGPSCLTNGVNAAIPYTNDACNGLKYDCETGQVWADTRPVLYGRRILKDDEAVVETNISGSSGTISITLNSDELGVCYTGMKTVYEGVLMLAAEFESPFIDDGAGGLEPEYGSLDNYSIEYSLNVNSASEGLIYTVPYLQREKFRNGLQFKKRVVRSDIPIVTAFDVNTNPVMTIEYSADARFLTPEIQRFDFRLGYVFRARAFAMKECDR